MAHPPAGAGPAGTVRTMDVTARTRRWLTDPVESGVAAGFGVYLHVPFCHHRCGYCDFATAAVGDRDPAEQQRLYDRYTDALCRDVARVAAGSTGRRVTSVFVGGGTPTLLGGARLARILATVGDHLDVATDAEVTVECNPETASVELFGALAAGGVTRVSMGAQSFAAHVLATLERGHTADRPVRAVAEAREGGIAEVSLDLIYGTPGESDADWDATLAAAVAADLDHVSAYALTIHDSTPFGRATQRGTMARPDDDVQAARFDRARQVLGAAGFDHYELSNWARIRRDGDGTARPRRSRHNVLYWRHGDYLAAGVGAHGHLDGQRRWVTRSTTSYLAAIEAGDDPTAGTEVLDDDERGLERLLLGLRLREGLHPSDLPPIEAMAFEDALDAGLVETSCGRLRCTDDGWFLLDEAVRRLAS